jgi:hypothetical protein
MLQFSRENIRLFSFLEWRGRCEDDQRFWVRFLSSFLFWHSTPLLQPWTWVA